MALVSADTFSIVMPSILARSDWTSTGIGRKCSEMSSLLWSGAFTYAVDTCTSASRRRRLLQTSSRFEIPSTLMLNAVLRCSLNFTVAAQWNTTFTFETTSCKLLSLIPSLGEPTSPPTGMHCEANEGHASRSRSKHFEPSISSRSRSSALFPALGDGRSKTKICPTPGQHRSNFSINTFPRNPVPPVTRIPFPLKNSGTEHRSSCSGGFIAAE
mmetsp:Transcript_14255/g.28428  ORF Transcript_14255/g.28428 Transcript_14255/m.28428 type:complete len:214 (-) Transcript_14255:195-836(-)